MNLSEIKLFNRYLNRGSLVYMFSLSFSGSKFLINLRRKFCVRKNFSCTQNFSYTSFCAIYSIHFVFKTTIPKKRNLVFRLIFH